ncbi:hypothetical protein HJG60_008937 [Phyllostomus discolor]|uniref:Uncharacterized protein n=1 Tax=Phyllostomus discolor TaxID=89673 RepID=A0A833YZU7_9CHIR|nr:hypothetical protein HJG60_008937 [Phyllostomus discolor]
MIGVRERTMSPSCQSCSFGTQEREDVAGSPWTSSSSSMKWVHRPPSLKAHASLRIGVAESAASRPCRKGPRRRRPLASSESSVPPSPGRLLLNHPSSPSPSPCVSPGSPELPLAPCRRAPARGSCRCHRVDPSRPRLCRLHFWSQGSHTTWE